MITSARLLYQGNLPVVTISTLDSRLVPPAWTFTLFTDQQLSCDLHLQKMHSCRNFLNHICNWLTFNLIFYFKWSQLTEKLLGSWCTVVTFLYKTCQRRLKWSKQTEGTAKNWGCRLNASIWWCHFWGTLAPSPWPRGQGPPISRGGRNRWLTEK